MKFVHHVVLEIFVKPGESALSALAAIDTLAPLPADTLRKTQWRWHPRRERTKVFELPQHKAILYEQETAAEGGTMMVFQYRFSKQADTSAFVKKLQAEVPEDDLWMIRKDIPSHLDGNGDLVLRFDKKALEHGLLRLKERGDCLVARLNLAAFPKSLNTCRKAAELILTQPTSS